MYRELPGGWNPDPQAWSDNPSYTATTSSLSSDKERIQAIDFSFLDNKNICCGLCGEIIPYDQLIDDHLPKNHPNVFRGDTSTVRAVPFEQWQKKLQAEQRDMETGFKMMAYKEAARAPKPPAPNRRPRRNISLIRVNPRDMTIEQLDVALRRKMFEKLGRHVPVALVDKIHARCGLCNAIISLNKKFEIIHLLLTLHDFAVVDAGDDTGENLQCIWCGTFIDSQCLAQHFGDMHSDNVEIPKCNLCLQELILNARFQEKYAVDFAITLPDEHHIECGLCGSSFSTDAAIEAHIRRRHISGISPDSDLNYFSEAEEVDSYDEVGPEAFANSRMILGKRRRPKRQFIMPIMRQAAPLNSQYVEPIAESHWKCKLCDGDIFGAVISAAAIKHYKLNHLLQLDHLQYELCCARLDRVSDGCMEFLHPRLIECLLCEQTFSLHQAFNMCRAIRHLKAKHPNLMPEYAGLQREDSGGAAYGQDDPYYTG
ncbi:unnamed protein product [Soboliphyme baturini]|uniref:C2H2-type domain-containing protein n=1 Tax=Soboliphyme baturini TaxID=241478 RepID=A0A183ISH8_9BILA|nr:unnamed protein product [Soboliphyme baturini]